jgi:hypothetical protein
MHESPVRAIGIDVISLLWLLWLSLLPTTTYYLRLGGLWALYFPGAGVATAGNAGRARKFWLSPSSSTNISWK